VTTTVESVCLPKDSWEKDKLPKKIAAIKKKPRGLQIKCNMKRNGRMKDRAYSNACTSLLAAAQQLSNLPA